MGVPWPLIGHLQRRTGWKSAGEDFVEPSSAGGTVRHQH